MNPLTISRQKDMAERWWLATAAVLLDPDDHPHGAMCPEPTPSDAGHSMIECRAHGITMIAYEHYPHRPLTGHAYIGDVAYDIYENATDDEITALAHHTKAMCDTLATIEDRRWADQ